MMLFLFIILSILAFALAHLLHGILSTPILDLAKLNDDISLRGDYSLRGEYDGTDEIRTLYSSFNSMLDTLELRQKERDKAERESERLTVELKEKNHELGTNYFCYFS